MTWRRLLLLGALGLGVAVFVAAFQSSPGYMDADSYYAGGRQLATGQGFRELYLWNYLDNPTGLPHPSNAYWMPLASLLAAAGAFLFGSQSWMAARIGFLVVAAAIPPITAALAWSITTRHDLAFASGLLAVFPAFYLPFLAITDTFGIYMLLGGLFFLLLFRFSPTRTRTSLLLTALLLGIISGLMHLARADGLLWLLLALLAIIYFREDIRFRSGLFYCVVSVLLGYLFVMAPWFARNISVFGVPLAPGGTKMLWLTSYDQLFTYPASQLNWVSWWHSGISAILKARLWALGLNLATSLAVQTEIFLLPLIGIGLWVLRKNRRVQLAALAWVLTLAAMTVAFPFAGARGGFFHSGAALQTVWWVLAPIGLEQVIEWGRQKRGWNGNQAGKLFRSSMIILAVLLTGVIFWSRIIGNGGYQSWSQEPKVYSQIEAYLVFQGAKSTDTIMVSNPPGFYLASGNPAIAVPDGDSSTLLTVARRYHATFLVLEKGSIPAGLLTVYDDPNGLAELEYLGEVDHARVFLFPQY